MGLQDLVWAGGSLVFVTMLGKKGQSGAGTSVLL